MEDLPIVAGPGVLSSEFWITAGVTVVSLLVGFGIIQVGAQDSMVAAVRAIVGGVVAIIAVVRYIEARQAVKETAIVKSAEVRMAAYDAEARAEVAMKAAGAGR